MRLTSSATLERHIWKYPSSSDILKLDELNIFKPLNFDVYTDNQA